MLDTRKSAFLSLVLIFLSGVAVGGIAIHLLTINSVIPGANAATRRPDPEEIRKHLVTEMKTRVKLDDQQIAELQKIYDETRANFDKFNEQRNAEARALRDNQTVRIKAMLRADQIPLFDQLHAEHEAEHKRRHPEQKK
jgi:hypothetical protein